MRLPPIGARAYASVSVWTEKASSTGCVRRARSRVCGCWKGSPSPACLRPYTFAEWFLSRPTRLVAACPSGGYRDAEEVAGLSFTLDSVSSEVLFELRQ